MNATINGDVVLVTLSRTNLRTLLHKLDNPSSFRTLCRSCENGVDLIVHAEEDENHYRDRKRGVMSPETEKALERAQADGARAEHERMYRDDPYVRGAFPHITTVGIARWLKCADELESALRASAPSNAESIVQTLKAVDDPYEPFEGNGEACRFCFSRRRETHKATCVWQLARTAARKAGDK